MTGPGSVPGFLYLSSLWNTEGGAEGRRERFKVRKYHNVALVVERRLVFCCLRQSGLGLKEWLHVLFASSVIMCQIYFNEER